jgi:hypothetical protein
MAKATLKGQGTTAKPWNLKTPPGTSEFQAYRDDTLDPPVLVVIVGKTELCYPCGPSPTCTRCSKRTAIGCRWAADEQKPAARGTVEAWGRSPKNPVGGWYGLKKGLRGRFGMYVPPVMEALGLAEVEHNPKSNRMRAR